MTYCNNALLLCLCFVSLVTGLEPEPGVRQCRRLELSIPNGEPIFYQLAPAVEGRFFIPFTMTDVKVGSSKQCNQIGPFLKVLCHNLLVKMAQILRDFWAVFKDKTLVKTVVASEFLINFWKIWATFYSNIWSHWPQIRETPLLVDSIS